MAKSVEEILEELIGKGWFGKRANNGKSFDAKEDIDLVTSRAKSELKTLMLGCVPDKKDEDNAILMGNTEDIYYNQAIADTTKAIEDLFK